MLNIIRRSRNVLALFALCLAIPSPVILAAEGMEMRDWVSIVNLIATPEKYEGRRVMLSGFVVIRFEQTMVCLSRDAPSSKDCLWLKIYDGPLLTQADATAEDAITAEWIEKYHGKVVRMRATFDSTDLGHLGAQSGTLTNIQVIAADTAGVAER